MQSSIMSCIAANPIGKASRLGGGGARPAAAAAARRRVLLRSGGDSPAGAVEGSEQQAASAVPPPLSPSVLPLPEGLPEQEVSYVARSTGQQLWTSTKLCFALPWRRFKSKSALVLKLGGEIAEQPQGRFSSTASLPALCDCLHKAAYDPRVTGLIIKVDPLACGWGKLQELRRHIELFRASGKWTMAYMERAGEKEFYLASACEELYAPPSASVSLRGLSVSGTFLRGALEKVGVEPEVRRIGKFKSAGDQLLREDMSAAQRLQLTELLDDIYQRFLSDIAASRGKSVAEVEALVNDGVFEMEELCRRGFVTALKYECELEEELQRRTGGKEDEVAKVGYRKYKSVSRSAFGLSGKSKKVLAFIRTSGAITGTEGGSGGSITSSSVIRQLRSVKKNKNVAAVVLRVDSPGGDALASDLMWREIRELAATKPVVASMADVAASGGYYMAMACSHIVAEPLTITGSIGVITGKFNLAKLYYKLGYNKEIISRGKYAQLLAETRALSPEEAELFDASAQHAYESFRDKAALSRGMTREAMQEVAQGRVWSGQRASTIGLVDSVGGINRALQLAKLAAGLQADEPVRVQELSRAQTSPLQLLSGGGGASLLATLGMLLLQTLAGTSSAAGGMQATQVALGAAPLMSSLLSAAAGAGGAVGPTGSAAAAAGQVMAAMPEVAIEGVATQALLSGGNSPQAPSWGASSGGLFDEQ